MRLRKKSIIGRIDSKGVLQANWQTLFDFCAMHIGRGVILRAEILPKEPSEKTTNYFFGYIVSEVQGVLAQEYGERYTKEQAYDWIRKQCPLFAKEERKDGEWKTILKDWEELDSAEAGEVIEWAVQYFAENFYLILEYPNE